MTRPRRDRAVVDAMSSQQPSHRTRAKGASPGGFHVLETPKRIRKQPKKSAATAAQASTGEPVSQPTTQDSTQHTTSASQSATDNPSRSQSPDVTESRSTSPPELRPYDTRSGRSVSPSDLNASKGGARNRMRTAKNGRGTTKPRASASVVAAAPTHQDASTSYGLGSKRTQAQSEDDDAGDERPMKRTRTAPPPASNKRSRASFDSLFDASFSDADADMSGDWRPAKRVRTGGSFSRYDGDPASASPSVAESSRTPHAATTFTSNSNEQYITHTPQRASMETPQSALSYSSTRTRAQYQSPFDLEQRDANTEDVSGQPSQTPVSSSTYESQQAAFAMAGTDSPSSQNSVTRHSTPQQPRFAQTEFYGQQSQTPHTPTNSTQNVAFGNSEAHTSDNIYDAEDEVEVRPANRHNYERSSQSSAPIVSQTGADTQNLLTLEAASQEHQAIQAVSDTTGPTSQNTPFSDSTNSTRPQQDNAVRVPKTRPENKLPSKTTSLDISRSTTKSKYRRSSISLDSAKQDDNRPMSKDDMNELKRDAQKALRLTKRRDAIFAKYGGSISVSEHADKAIDQSTVTLLPSRELCKMTNSAIDKT